jgi:hypothetical protein
MTAITLAGPEPYDLEAQQHIVSIALGGIVTTTLRVCAHDTPGAVFEIRLHMSPDEADRVSAQLRLAVGAARNQRTQP